MSEPAATLPPGTTDPPPPVDEFDPLFSPIEGDLFAAKETYKGLPPAKAIIDGLTPDAQRLLHNTRVGAQTKIEEQNAALAAANARIAELQAQVAPPAVRTPSAPAEFAGDSPMLRKLYGLEEGDPFDGEQGDDDAPSLAAVEKIDAETLADPERAKAVFAELAASFTDRLKNAEARAKQRLAAVSRESVRPFEAAQAQAAQVAQAQSVAQRQASFRAARPGLNDEANFQAYVDHLDTLFPPVNGARSALNDAQLDAGYASWASKAVPDAYRAYVTPAPPAAPPPVATPAERAASTADVISKLRRGAQDAVTTGGLAGSAAAPLIPANLTDEQRANWLRAHPEAAAALREANANGGMLAVRERMKQPQRG